MSKLKCLDLFSGIGGMTLGLGKAGIKTIAFVEYDKHCQQVLKHNWPNIPIYGDICKTRFTKLKDRVDIICGGYPCVGHSVAGSKKGLKNEESKLWYEYLRAIKEVMPKYCIIENSPNLRNTGLVELLKTVNAVGYNAEWSVISGYFVGSISQRERIYIVLWRKDIPYCDPFRWFSPDLEKEKSQSHWWTKRRFKRNPLFKQASKIEPRVLQFDDGLSQETLECEAKIKMLGNSLLPVIPELIGRRLVEVN